MILIYNTKTKLFSDAGKHYSFLMIKYLTPKFIRDIQSELTDNDLFINNDYDGIESETHVTLAPCMDNKDWSSDNDLLSVLKPISSYNVLCKNISLFEQEDHDVLKVDVYSDELFNTNKIIKDKFGLHTEYTDYHPHLTIAYVKKGKGDKFVSKLDDIELTPKEFISSYYINDKMVEVKF